MEAAMEIVLALLAVSAGTCSLWLVVGFWLVFKPPKD